jgi:hypothetical protein
LVGAASKAEAAGVSRERTTLVPSFDVSQLAHDSDRWTHAEQSSSAPPRGPAVQGGSVLVRAADVYWSRIGGRAVVPILMAPLEAIPDEDRARCGGFILCRIDGVTTLAQIIENSGLPELTGLSLACDLFDNGIIGVSNDASRTGPVTR